MYTYNFMTSDPSTLTSLSTYLLRTLYYHGTFQPHLQLTGAYTFNPTCLLSNSCKVLAAVRSYKNNILDADAADGLVAGQHCVINVPRRADRLKQMGVEIDTGFNGLLQCQH